MKSDIELKQNLNLDTLYSNSVNDISFLESEESCIGQETLYGAITPAPTKYDKNTKLPALTETLRIPKQRSRPSTMSDVSTKSSTPKRLNQKVLKRPSTCGKEGIRNFSTPLPLKVKSLADTAIPTLSPDISINDKLTNTTFDNTTASMDFSFEKTPLLAKLEHTSPIALRSFSSPLADLRLKSTVQPALQIKLSQASPNEYLGENERQLRREIMKLQTEINIMKKVKKYRDSKDSRKLTMLIDKWKKNAEMASNYIYNQASMKVSRMGGMNEFRKRQKKSKLRRMKFEFDESMLYRLEEYMETEEFRSLDKYDQNELRSKKIEMEKMSEKIENGEILISDDDPENEEGSDEFTMKDLYKQLGLDYELVYGFE